MSPAQPGRFHPIELSDPLYEHEHLRNLTFYSRALQGRGDVSLFIPPGLDPSASSPIVVLLHGVYGSYWSWFLKGGVHRTVLDLIQRQQIRPMMIIAPSDGLRGDGTAYIPNMVQDYEAWIADDLIQCTKDLFCQSAVNIDVFIAGLSMGGYGALRLGAKYPDRFRGISAHSAITSTEQFGEFVRDISCFQLVPLKNLDLLYWFRRHRQNCRHSVLIADERIHYLNQISHCIRHLISFRFPMHSRRTREVIHGLIGRHTSATVCSFLSGFLEPAKN